MSIPQHGSRDGDSYELVEDLLRGLAEETIASVRTITNSSAACQKVIALAEERLHARSAHTRAAQVRRDVLVQRHHR